MFLVICFVNMGFDVVFFFKMISFVVKLQYLFLGWLGLYGLKWGWYVEGGVEFGCDWYVGDWYVGFDIIFK